MTEDLLILGELIAEQAAHMDAAEHRLLTNIRDFDAREGWASAMSCAHWLAWRVGWTLGTAREHVRVAKALGTLPHIDEALRLGKVSYCKVRAMTRVATPLNEQVLLMDAQLSTGSQLEKVCRKYKQLRRYADGANPDDDDVQRCVTRRDLDNGMVRITAVLHPEEAALVWAALDQATKELLADERAFAAPHVDEVRLPTPSTNVSAETSATSRKSSTELATRSANHECRSSDVSAEPSTSTNPRPTTELAGRSASDECRPSDVSAETSTSVGPQSTNELATRSVNDECRSSDVSAETSTSHYASWAPPQGDETSTASETSAVDENEDEYGREAHRGCSFYDAVFGEVDDDHQSLRSQQTGRFDDEAFPDENDPIDDGEEHDPSHRRAAGGSTMVATEHRTAAAADAAPRDSGQVGAGVNAGDRPPTSGPKRNPRFNRADGIVALARRFACGDSSRTPVEIVVTVPAAALQQAASPEESVAFLGDGGCVTAETARRLACDAGIVYMVEDEHGQPLTVGRRTRSIPTSIRRALLHRDKTCRFPGCTNRVYLDGHHIEHWANGGETALQNLVAVCGHHHKFVHEYNYRVEIDPTGTPCFFDDRGRPVKDVPTRYAREDLGWEHIQAANRELEIAPHVCGWNGEPVQYAEVCRALYRLDDGTLRPEDIM